MKPQQTVTKLSFDTPTHEQSVVVGDRSVCASFQEDIDSLHPDSILLVLDRGLLAHKEYALEEYTHSLNELNVPVKIIDIEVNNLTKDFEMLEMLLVAMSEFGLTRKGILIGIGGGSLLDTIGVAAAVYLRGIRYCTVPTSFISMADGIISKVAVNLNGRKNIVGAFYSPVASYCDTSFLENQPFATHLPGLVEIWKESLIVNDIRVTAWINDILERQQLASNDFIELITWSMNIKSEHIINDWRDETGSHKALSLGHTLANFLEMQLPIHHGEAILYGMYLEGYIARNKKLLNAAAHARFNATIHQFDKYFNKYEMIKPILSKNLFEQLRKDKINHHGIIKFVLPTTTAYEIVAVSEDELRNALELFVTIPPAEIA